LLKPLRNIDILFSPNMKRYFHKSYNTVIQNAVNAEEFKGQTDKFEKFTFLAVGHLREAKNYPFLLKCAKELKKSFDFQILIAGEGKLRQELQEIIQKEELEEHVFLLGDVENIPKLLQRSHCLVMPSLWEGMPIAILEAGASGLLVIATPVGSISSVLNDANAYLATMNELNIRSNSTIIEIQGKKIKTLQPDLLLVYLCSHGSKHMWERIEWITDIDRLICNVESINWEMVWGYAQKMHSINTLLLGLSLSQELFGTNLPAFIEEKLNSHGNIQSLKTDTLELLHHNASSQAQSSGITAMFKKFGYHSKLHDSFWDKAKFYFTIFFKVTPDDVLNINLPKQLYFLYYIIRPFRLIYSRLNYTDK